MVIWRFRDYLPANPKHLTVEHIETYLQSVLKTSCRRTANAHLTAIKSFCKWLQSQDVFGNGNPADKVKMLREDPGRQRVLTEAEYNEVLNACKTEQESDLIRFIYFTGLRATELQTLTYENISSDGRFLQLTTHKSHRRDIVPLNKAAQQIVAKYRHKPNVPVFTLLKSPHDYTKRNSVYILCKRLSRHAAIPQFGPHALRHFGATQLMRKGVSIAKISKFYLRHKSIRTTERIYIHWNVQDALGVTDALE
jgi:integrase